MNAGKPTNSQPFVPAPLDPGFQPAVLFNRDYLKSVNKSATAVPLVIGLEREGGLLSRYETIVDPNAGAASLLYVERIVKFLLWARGGWKIHLGGPQQILHAGLRSQGRPDPGPP